MIKKFDKWLRSINVVDTLKFGIKILVALRWAYDTYEVSVAQGATWYVSAFNVLVIDALFTTFWLLASSHSRREEVEQMRVPAAVGAWVMAGGMLWIAGSIGQGTTLVARVGGLLMLAFDTYALLQGAISQWQERRRLAREDREHRERSESVEQRRQRTRDNAWKVAYATVVRTIGVVIIFFRSLRLIREDVSEDLEVMGWHRENARNLRKAQAGMGAVAPLGKSETPFVIEEMGDGMFNWSCRLCGQEGNRRYKSKGAAKFGWTSHSRHPLPGHDLLTASTSASGGGPSNEVTDATND